MTSRVQRFSRSGAAALIASVVGVMSPVAADGTTALGPCTAGAPTGAARGLSRQIAISRINPDIGSVAGGTSVTLNGTGLDLVTAIRFGNICTTQFDDRDSETLTVTAPPSTTAGFVHIVAEGQGHSRSSAVDRFHYLPEITGLSPSSGPPGTLITISGHGFTGARSVVIENDDRDIFVAAPVHVISDDEVTTVAPADTLVHGAVQVRVRAPGGTSMFGMYDRFILN